MAIVVFAVLAVIFVGLLAVCAIELLLLAKRDNWVPDDVGELIARFGLVGTLIGLAIVLILLNRSRSRSIQIHSAHRPYAAD